MKRFTRNLLIGGAVVAAAGGALYYYEKKKGTGSHPVPTGTLTAGQVVPVTQFQPGVKYTFAATVPAGITDNVALTTALQAAGWGSPNVIYFMGNGNLPAGFQGNTSSYVASGTWNGAANAAVPAGVIAAATP